jgi:SPFH domain / Band 7 family
MSTPPFSNIGITITGQGVQTQEMATINIKAISILRTEHIHDLTAISKRLGSTLPKETIENTIREIMIEVASTFSFLKFVWEFDTLERTITDRVAQRLKWWDLQVEMVDFCLEVLDDEQFMELVAIKQERDQERPMNVPPISSIKDLTWLMV